MRYWSGLPITKLGPNNVLVFGSNPEGRHGKGSAKLAMKFGAKYGCGRGLQGQTYALVTKNLTRGFVEPFNGIKYELSGEKSVSKDMIRDNIVELYNVVNNHPNLNFILVYQDNLNLNGYCISEFIRLFVDGLSVPNNFYFHCSLKRYLE